MKRHASRLVPTALAAVLVLGACGSADDDALPDPPTDQGTDDGLRAPTPIEVTGGQASGDRVAGSAEVAASGDAAMIAPYFQVEYVLGDGLVAPADDTGWVFDLPGELTADEVARVAAALGVEGEPIRIDDGYAVSWRVGPEDGTAPSLWVSGDAQQYWNYSSAWANGVEARVACAVAVDSEGNETSVEDCPEPEPPVGVPTAAEAEARATELLTALGVDPAGLAFDTYADEWFASVTANDTRDPRSTVVSWNFGFGPEGVLQYAGGSLAEPVPVGPYPLIDIDTAFRRLQDQNAGYGIGGPLADTPALGAPEPMPIEPDVAESGEPGMDGSVASEPAMDEPLPVDGTVPEPETLTVTLVDVQADLWWAWDTDGAVWLLPAYRFVGDDGGWYTVPAVTDEYLIRVDPPEEPMPVEPMPVEPVPADPDVVNALGLHVGLPLEEFTANANALAFEVRVVERDGEPLVVTEDFRTDRVNVAVVTVDGVEQVVRATLDDGTVLGEVTIEPVEPTEPPVEPGTDPSAAPVPVVNVVEGVQFYPACGDEILALDGDRWYQVQQSDYPDEYAAIFAVEREDAPATATINGFARVVAPGPGDDIGTLVVWADGVARFVSDSGDLTAWLVDDELTYQWTC